jgi:hypothetical protein
LIHAAEFVGSNCGEMDTGVNRPEKTEKMKKGWRTSMYFS